MIYFYKLLKVHSTNQENRWSDHGALLKKKTTLMFFYFDNQFQVHLDPLEWRYLLIAMTVYLERDVDMGELIQKRKIEIISEKGDIRMLNCP